MEKKIIWEKKFKEEDITKEKNHKEQIEEKPINYQKLTLDEKDEYIQLHIRQQLEEGATEDINLAPSLKDYNMRHNGDGTFVGNIWVDSGNFFYKKLIIIL